jgi:hypothetical protein
MRSFLFLFIFILTSSLISAQTICTTVVAYPEQVITTQELKLLKEAVYRWDVIPEVLPLYQYVTENILVCDAYDKLTTKADGTKCITSVPAKYTSVTTVKTLREGQQPQWIKVLVSQAEYQTIPVCRKIKDAKILVLNSECK